MEGRLCMSNQPWIMRSSLEVTCYRCCAVFLDTVFPAKRTVKKEKVQELPSTADPRLVVASNMKLVSIWNLICRCGHKFKWVWEVPGAAWEIDAPKCKRISVISHVSEFYVTPNHLVSCSLQSGWISFVSYQPLLQQPNLRLEAVRHVFFKGSLA